MTTPPMTKEQLDYFTEQTRHAVNKALRRYSASSLVAWLVILLAAGFVAGSILNTINERSVHSCVRLNIVRAQSNISDSVSWTILSNSGIREHTLVQGDPNNAQTHRRSAQGLFTQAARLTVTPLTDCRAAQDPAYQYPLAGPLGDPRTGQLTTVSKGVLRTSERLIARKARG